MCRMIFFKWICSIKLQKQKQDLLDFLKLIADLNEVWLEKNNIFHFSHEFNSLHTLPTILQDHFVFCTLMQIHTWTLI